MNEHELRFIELTYRIGILNEMKSKLNDELKNKTMLFLAKALDSGIEEKQVSMIAIIDKWIKEIDEELNTLEGRVFQKYMKDAYEQMEKKLEEKSNGNQ